MSQVMHVHLTRYSDNGESTLGLIHVVLGSETEFVCYALEDTHRAKKIYGQTRIPKGDYPITLRTVGRFHRRYKKRYGSMHKGMLWVRDIPNYEFVLFHAGNHREHTKGCILPASDVNPYHAKQSRANVSASRIAYKKLYNIVAPHLAAGKKAVFSITELDRIDRLI